MEYRSLGNSGLKVSVVGLGTNNFGGRTDEPTSARVLERALDLGITLIDTAESYSGGKSERIIGKTLGGRRDQALIATKFGWPNPDRPQIAPGSRRSVRMAVEGSLRRLQTDYIDLYQMHRPDPETPIEETLSALDDLIHEGKVRYIGSSGFAGWQIADADWTSRAGGLERFVSAQNEYSLLNREVEREVIPACRHFGIGMIPFFPLAAGLLTGKYKRGQPPPAGTRLAGQPAGSRWLRDEMLATVDELRNWAEQHDVSLLRLAIGALAAQPAVTSVIAGATKPEQVEANVAAGGWRPTPEQLGEIDRIVPSSHPE